MFVSRAPTKHTYRHTNYMLIAGCYWQIEQVPFILTECRSILWLGKIWRFLPKKAGYEFRLATAKESNLFFFLLFKQISLFKLILLLWRKTNLLPFRVLPKVFKTNQTAQSLPISLQPCQASHYSVDPRCLLGQSLPIPSSTPLVIPLPPPIVIPAEPALLLNNLSRLCGLSHYIILLSRLSQAHLS